jgi:Mrp family chromosome partitioning ATPase
LVVDGDLRCSALTARLGRRNRLPGLAEVIRGDIDLDAAVVADGPDLHILPAGNANGSPVQLLSSPAFARLLRAAEVKYDVVIVDSPPVLIGSDAWLIGSLAEATILVTRWASTPNAIVQAAVRQLRDVGVSSVGIVLSAVNINSLARYDDGVSVSVSRSARRYYASTLAHK